MEKILKKMVDIKKYLRVISQKRIEHFREFPYLYQGNLEYEREYLEGFASSEKSILVISQNDSEKIEAFSTAIPMKKEVSILSELLDKFKDNKLNASNFFYISEVIVEKHAQQKGFLRKHLNIIEDYARDHGYRFTCFLTVERDIKDPRKPTEYFSHDEIFKKVNYKKTNIKVKFEWPTIQLNKSIKNQENDMVFWMKSL